MASLLTEPLFQDSGRGPPPNNHFYSFTLTKSHVTWRWWKISPRAVDRSSKPGELKESHQDFLDDPELQRDVSMVFGCQTLQYAKALCQGHYDYLERLPDSFLLKVISYLELEDVGQLARTSRRFRTLCGSEAFWEQTVRQRCNTVSAEVASLSLEVGWRNIFFTNKLQLQKLISRRKLKIEEQQEELVSHSDTKTAGSPDESLETNQTSVSEGEPQPGIIADSGLGPDTSTDFDKRSCSDVDPDPKPEPETGSDSNDSVPDQFLFQLNSDTDA